jgi:hypothetical protein
VLSLEGQHVVKNLVIAAAAIVVLRAGTAVAGVATRDGAPELEMARTSTTS